MKKKTKRSAGFSVGFKITDEVGDGPFTEIVVIDPIGDKRFPILFVHFDEPATVGSRFTYEGTVWELTKEVQSYEDLWIKGKSTCWDARPAKEEARRGREA